APCPAGRCPPLPACTGRLPVPTSAGHFSASAQVDLSHSCFGRDAAIHVNGILRSFSDALCITVFPQQTHSSITAHQIFVAFQQCIGTASTTTLAAMFTVPALRIYSKQIFYFSIDKLHK